MTKRVIQTSPDIGLTIRLPRRQTVVQPQTVAAAPGAPVWLGWQAQGGLPCARLMYPDAAPSISIASNPWSSKSGQSELTRLSSQQNPYPQAWLAGVPPQDTSSDDWRICQRITWTARATLKIRAMNLDGVPNDVELTPETVARNAKTVWEREIELEVPAPTWPDGLYDKESDYNTGAITRIAPRQPDPRNCCQWTAPPEGLPFAPPRDIAPGGRQLLRLTRDDFDFYRINTLVGVQLQHEPGATSLGDDYVCMANLPAVVPFDRAGTLLVTTAAYNVIGDTGLLFDTDLHCSAHDENGRALGDVSLHLPVIHFEQDVNM